MRAAIPLALAASAAGCGPMVPLPPPVPMVDGRQYEFGVGVNGAFTLQDDGVPSFRCDNPVAYGGCGGGGAQVWYRFSASPRVDFVALVFAGSTSLGGTGVGLRYRALDLDGFFASLNVDGGIAWAGLGATAGWALADNTWLTFTPSVAVHLHAPLRLGVGVWHTLPMGLSVGVDATGAAQPDAYWGLETLPASVPTASVSLAVGFQPNLAD